MALMMSACAAKADNAGGSPEGADAPEPDYIVLKPGEGRSADLASVGIFNTTKLGNGELGSTFDVMETEVAPNAGPPRHVHRTFDEAFYVLEGDFRIAIADATFDAPPGSFVYIPRGVAHTWTNTGDRPARVLSLGTPASLEGFLTDLGAASAETGDARWEAMLDAYAVHATDVVGPPLRDGAGPDEGGDTTGE